MHINYGINNYTKIEIWKLILGPLIVITRQILIADNIIRLSLFAILRRMILFNNLLGLFVFMNSLTRLRLTIYFYFISLYV